MSQDQLVLTRESRCLTPTAGKYSSSSFTTICMRVLVSTPRVGTERTALHLRCRGVLPLACDSSSDSLLTPSPARRASSRRSTSTDTTRTASELHSSSMTMCGPPSLIRLLRATSYQEKTLRGYGYEVFSPTQPLAREHLRARIRSNDSFPSLKPLERQVEPTFLCLSHFCCGRTP
jgi:hypothetical protein